MCLQQGQGHAGHAPLATSHLLLMIKALMWLPTGGHRGATKKNLLQKSTLVPMLYAAAPPKTLLRMGEKWLLLLADRRQLGARYPLIIQPKSAVDL